MMWMLTRVVGFPQTQGCPHWGWFWCCLGLCRAPTSPDYSSVHAPSPLPWTWPHFMSSGRPLRHPCPFCMLEPADGDAGGTPLDLHQQGLPARASRSRAPCTMAWSSLRSHHFSPTLRGCKTAPGFGEGHSWPHWGCLQEGAGLFWLLPCNC